MANRQPTPTDPRRTQTPAAGHPDQPTAPAENQKASPDGTTSTQENMGDGAGIRGEYGNASQTNGMEGGPDTPRTDTELTGS